MKDERVKSLREIDVDFFPVFAWIDPGIPRQISAKIVDKATEC
jgi:hypothetical protein